MSFISIICSCCLVWWDSNPSGSKTGLSAEAEHHRFICTLTAGWVSVRQSSKSSRASGSTPSSAHSTLTRAGWCFSACRGEDKAKHPQITTATFNGFDKVFFWKTKSTRWHKEARLAPGRRILLSGAQTSFPPVHHPDTTNDCYPLFTPFFLSTF